MFIREITPSGLSTTSIGFPSSVNGISSSATTMEMIPLFPCFPANLSQTSIFLVLATYTLIFFLTPAIRLSHFFASRMTTSMTFPSLLPDGTYNDVSLTFFDLSQKIAWMSFSSGVSSPSDLGVIFPMRISHHLTMDPILITPSSSRFLSLIIETPGISLVVSSGPSLVSATSISYSSICMDVSSSSFTNLWEMTIASS